MDLFVYLFGTVHVKDTQSVNMRPLSHTRTHKLFLIHPDVLSLFLVVEETGALREMLQCTDSGRTCKL